MPPDFLAKNYTNDILKYFDKETDSAQTVLLVEPGDPHSARLVSLMRDSFIRKNFMPLSPCPHIHVCPMAGRTSSNPGGKWCNFAFDTADAPEELLKFSKKCEFAKRARFFELRFGQQRKNCKNRRKTVSKRFRKSKTESCLGLYKTPRTAQIRILLLFRNWTCSRD